MGRRDAESSRIKENDMKADFRVAIYGMVDTIALLREINIRSGSASSEECDKIINEELVYAYKLYEGMPEEELKRTVQELQDVLEKVAIWT